MLRVDINSNWQFRALLYVFFIYFICLRMTMSSMPIMYYFVILFHLIHTIFALSVMLCREILLYRFINKFSY